jgi:hypothetical protein
MSKELKQLFESAGVPQELGAQATAIFEAAVSEAADARLVEQTAQLQEAFEARFEETKTAWLTEQTAHVEAVLDQALAEWANDNVVAIDSQLKVQVAESFMAGISAALVNEGFALKNEGETLTEKFKQDSDQTLALAESLQGQLNEAQAELNKFRKAEVMAAVTEGMSVLSADRVRSLCEKLTFTDLEAFKSQAQAIAEAFGKTKLNEGEKKGDEEDKSAKPEDKGVDDADTKPEDKKAEDEEGKNPVNEAYDPAAAAAAFLKTGKLVKA